MNFTRSFTSGIFLFVIGTVMLLTQSAIAIPAILMKANNMSPHLDAAWQTKLVGSVLLAVFVSALALWLYKQKRHY